MVMALGGDSWGSPPGYRLGGWMHSRRWVSPGVPAILAPAPTPSHPKKKLWVMALERWQGLRGEPGTQGSLPGACGFLVAKGRRERARRGGQVGMRGVLLPSSGCCLRIAWHHSTVLPLSCHHILGRAVDRVADGQSGLDAGQKCGFGPPVAAGDPAPGSGSRLGEPCPGLVRGRKSRLRPRWAPSLGGSC